MGTSWKIVSWTRGDREGSGEVLVLDRPKKRKKAGGAGKAKKR